MAAAASAAPGALCTPGFDVPLVFFTKIRLARDRVFGEGGWGEGNGSASIGSRGYKVVE